MTDTLRPCLLAYKRVKSRALDNLCLRWQLHLASEDINEIEEGVNGKLISLTYNNVSKKGSSSLKTSKNYKKGYVGQGK